MWAMQMGEEWTECGCCGCYHPAEFAGDCRDDVNRLPGPPEAIAELG
jgi:hypothetical protein